MGKTVRKSFDGRNLQQMTRVTKGLCSYKNSDPKGLSAHALLFPENWSPSHNFLVGNFLLHQWKKYLNFGLETTLSIQESSTVNLVQSLSNQ